MKNKDNIILSVIAVVAIVLLLGVVGEMDWTEQVILHMTKTEYAIAKEHLTLEHNGREPSENEIARWWKEHHKEYECSTTH